MKRTLSLFSAVFLCGLLFIAALPVAAGETVTPDEVIAKVREAAAYLSGKGEAGLSEFNDPKGPWAWKDTYVFVFNCAEGIIVAHPTKELIGTRLEDRIDKNGFKFNLALCEEAKKPNGGWVEYWRPSDAADATGAAEFRRKVSYILKVQGQPYEVGAGIYEPTMSIDELTKMIEGVK